ncbi:MAG: hypothetical protein MZV64_50450, partial [Ignavibacteriales bacterium]|nr:hypothetical protein [Ignavibacteriales bacterium]
TQKPVMRKLDYFTAVSYDVENELPACVFYKVHSHRKTADVDAVVAAGLAGAKTADSSPLIR